MNETYNDESLQGSYTIIKEPKIKPRIKPHFIEGKERRFKEDAITRVIADEPILNYLKTRKNEWTSARQFIDDLGMASRTVYDMCKRLTLHEVLEMKNVRIPDDAGNVRKARLYRLSIKNKDDSRRNSTKN